MKVKLELFECPTCGTDIESIGENRSEVYEWCARCGSIFITEAEGGDTEMKVPERTRLVDDIAAREMELVALKVRLNGA